MPEQTVSGQEQTYAVVFYLGGPLARLVDELRVELNPIFAGKLAHVTVLPPRPLIISEEAAVEEARAQLADWVPFDIEINGVGTFFPVNGVVFLEITRNARAIYDMHHTLNRGILYRQEPYPFKPHITISQGMDEQRTFEVMRRVSEVWEEFTGAKTAFVDRLVFVRQAPSGDWDDLAEILVGGAAVPAQ